MKKLLLVNFIITYTLIVFPFPFSNMEKSLMYNKIGYFYINHIVMPEYGFFKCSTFVSCNGKFPKYLTKVKIKEFSSEWQIKDFVKKIDYPPYRLVDNIEELNTINGINTFQQLNRTYFENIEYFHKEAFDYIKQKIIEHISKKESWSDLTLDEKKNKLKFFLGENQLKTSTNVKKIVLVAS